MNILFLILSIFCYVNVQAGQNKNKRARKNKNKYIVKNELESIVLFINKYETLTKVKESCPGFFWSEYKVGIQKINSTEVQELLKVKLESERFIKNKLIDLNKGVIPPLDDLHGDSCIYRCCSWYAQHCMVDERISLMKQNIENAVEEISRGKSAVAEVPKIFINRGAM